MKLIPEGGRGVAPIAGMYYVRVCLDDVHRFNTRARAPHQLDGGKRGFASAPDRRQRRFLPEIVRDTRKELFEFIVEHVGFKRAMHAVRSEEHTSELQSP